MKVCFFGLGSIGRRHVKNLVEIAQEMHLPLEIHSFRHTAEVLTTEIAPLIHRQIFNPKELETYDIIFITNPTHLHYQTIQETLDHTVDMFIEKPLFHHPEISLENLPLKQDSIYYVACPLRYHGVIEALKNLLKNTRVYGVRSICSSYLPEWRQNKDYRLLYSAKKEMGGGVSLDLIHELDYLTDLFGFPVHVINQRGTYSHLEITSDDLSIYILQYLDKIVELHLDYFGRAPRRQIEIFTGDDVIIGDLLEKKIRYLHSQREVTCENEDFYKKEMSYFLHCIRDRKKTHNELFQALQTLRLTGGYLT